MKTESDLRRIRIRPDLLAQNKPAIGLFLDLGHRPWNMFTELLLEGGEVRIVQREGHVWIELSPEVVVR